jgi:hypothetical protein
MLKMRYLILFVFVTQTICTQNIPFYTEKIKELEEQLEKCHNKKIALLQQCDAHNKLRKIDALQKFVDNTAPETPDSRRKVSVLQRTIAEHNRELLATMSAKDKAKLKELLQEYQALWLELCLHAPQTIEARQPQAFELFFI